MKALKILIAIAALSLTISQAAQIHSKKTQEPKTPPTVKVRVLDTGSAPTIEAFVYSGGSFFKKAEVAHPAILIQHPKANILFDTGLGRHAVEQTEKDMPWWARWLTSFKIHKTAAATLENENIKIDRIILSHVHFDHASGIIDFPGVTVWVTENDFDFIKTGKPPAVLPSVFEGPIKWHIYQFESKPYEGYPQSLDVMNDGTLVLVPMPGHTPGSVGLFVNISPEKRIFFVGDTVWSAESIKKGLPKFWLARKSADNDPDMVMQQIRYLQALQQRLPNLLIVPSHDPKSLAAVESMLNSK
jgi:glyoxylase-like metal-dependent hydrolase (beta-lactamase superfamily II)